MDGSNNGFANSNLFADSQQFHHAYDNLFSTGADQNLNDASWGVNASGYPNQNQSRVQQQPQQQQAAPSWQQNANHLSVNPTHAHFSGQASPYSRSLSHSPAPFAQNAFAGYGNQQNFQYSQAQYDPALFNASTSGQDFHQGYAGYGNQSQSAATVAPQALEHESRSIAPSGNPYNGPGYTQNGFVQPRPSQSTTPSYVDQQALMSSVPQGTDAGDHSIINFDQLVRATNSERMSSFLNIGKDARDWPVNRTTTLPQYVPRRSRNELRKLAGTDAALLAKIGKKSIKQKIATSTAGAAKPLTAIKAAESPVEIKYEDDSSSSEDESDDDDSSYTSDEDIEGSPLPNKRPDNPKDAVEYDTIKALWRSKRRPVDSAAIRKAMTDFWEVVKTIRDRWKSDSAAVVEEEKKKKPSDLALLKSRVKDQRDMMECAFRAALKHGHKSIIELLAENAALVFLCYQFLLDRAKEEDFNGALSRVILETMSQFTTITDDLLERVHLIKVLPRFVKRGDAKTQFYAKRIIANAAAASKQKSADSPATKPAAASKTTGSTVSPNKRPDPEPIAGVKRAASSAGDSGPQKKIATSTAKLNGTAPVTKGPVVKKPTATGETLKSSISIAAAPAIKTKQVTAKPSSFFSTLQSAAKKPGTSIKSGTPAVASGTKPAERKAVTATAAAPSAPPKPTFSFAETMANLAKPKEEEKTTNPQPEKQDPPETVDEKAKRLRKEARRKLHVKFKDSGDLVEIRYFTHDPEEELGHDYSQVRDVSDVGGEGRMLKMHMMDIDDEEDAVETEQKLIEFKEPKLIDFSDVDPEERKRNYAPYGGGELEPESPERAARKQYEANTLLVFYTDEKDIPPNPREPTDPYNGEPSAAVKQIGAPEHKYAARARQKRLATTARQAQTAPQANAAPFDLSALGNFMGNQNQQQQQAPYSQPFTSQPAPAVLSSDIQKILQSLQKTAPNPVPQQPQPAPTMGFGTATSAPRPASMNPVQPQQPNGQPQIDLAAIMAQITGGQQGMPQYDGSADHAATLGGFAQGPQMQHQQDMSAAGLEARERKRWRDQGEKSRFYKTKVCKYWQEGRCMKGAGCTYLHEEPEA